MRFGFLILRMSLSRNRFQLSGDMLLEPSLIGVVEVKPLLHFFLDRPAGHSLLFAVGAVAAA
jgi:hypothetical protein